MKIGIDGNEANTNNRVGIGQFAFNVLLNLEKIDNKNSYYIYLKQPPLGDLPPARAGWKYVVIGPKKLWTWFALPLRLFSLNKKLDVFYSPSHYAPRFSPFPTVISIMDLWHHRHPEQFDKKDLYQLINWEKYSVENAKAIITISDFSKSEIKQFYPKFKGEIKVAYPGYSKFKISNDKSQIKSKIQNIKQKYQIEGEYFLYLGTLQPKKNIEGLIKAFSIFILNTKTQSLTPRLVIAGKKGWQYESIYSLVKELKLESKVVFTGFIDEDDKPYLISGALAFILPSYYEGFGIPVAEAMSLGVPVVISNTGSLPEVGGKSAIYVNPSQPEGISGGLKKVLDLNPKQRDEIIRAGKDWVSRFSWENCAREVLGVLEAVGRESGH